MHSALFAKRRVAMLVGAWLLFAANCADASFMDWMFPGRTYRRYMQQPAYPVAYVVPPSVSTPATPTTAYYGYYAAPVLGGTPYVGQVANYPYPYQSAYRTVLAQVPTTTFSPVVTPSGLALQPYSGYSYQVQRTPYLSFQPVLGSYAPAVTAPAAGVPTSYGYQSYAPTVISDWQPVSQTPVATTSLSPMANPCEMGTSVSSLGYATASEFSPASSSCAPCNGMSTGSSPSYGSTVPGSPSTIVGPWEPYSGTAPSNGSISSPSMSPGTRPQLAPQDNLNPTPYDFQDQNRGTNSSSRRMETDFRPAASPNYVPTPGAIEPTGMTNGWASVPSQLAGSGPHFVKNSNAVDESYPRRAPAIQGIELQQPQMDGLPQSPPRPAAYYHPPIPDPRPRSRAWLREETTNDGDESETESDLLDRRGLHTARRPYERFEAVPIRWVTTQDSASQPAPPSPVRVQSVQEDEGQWRSVGQ